MRSGGAAHKLRSAASLVSQRAFSCFPTTVNRLPYNRLPRILPIASREAISSYTEGVLLHGSLPVKEPVNGYTVNG